MAIEAKQLMHLDDFTGLQLFGDITKSFNYKSKEHDGYRVNVIVMNPNSQIYLQNIQLKIKATDPTLKNIESYSNKQTDVELIGLNVGIYDSRLIFNCEDIIKKPTTNKS